MKGTAGELEHSLCLYRRTPLASLIAVISVFTDAGRRPSTFYAQKARQRDPDRRPAREKRDETLKPEIERVYDENFRVYGADKVWKQLNREEIEVARCTVARLMRVQGLQGVVRGRKAKTTIPDELADRLEDRLKRTFTAGIEPSVGSVGDSYANALAETIIGLYKTELIRRCGPWRSIDPVELATLEWVDWFNHRRLFAPIGDVPPAEKEDEHYRQLESAAVA